jgi:osmoprotectant transport system permease protein
MSLDVLAQVEIRKRTGEGCVQENGFCPSWIADNYDRYIDPFWEHVYLTLVSVGIGFAIAFVLALIAHRRRWLVGPIVGFTGVLYAIPSIAAFLLLNTGLNNVPEEMVDAGRGMGLTDRQLLWRVELPLALPEILAGLRIAVTTTVGLATLAFFAGAGGLGQEIYADINFKSNVVFAGGLAVLLAAVCDIVILVAQRLGRGAGRRRGADRLHRHAPAPQLRRRRDRVSRIDPDRALSRSRRQGRVPRGQRLERRARSADARAARLLHRVPRRRLPERHRRPRPAGDPADPD